MAGRVWSGLGALALALSLSGCGGTASRGPSLAGMNETPRSYPAPGPASDPWGPYLSEAAVRFSLPERWLRAVMRQESGGQQQAVSPAGAIGLMQLMPPTYAQMRDQYGLGNDPFQPHDNILAGSAYLAQMYQRFGAPGFLAAYNAGPERLQSYLDTGQPLPDETVNYVAAIGPALGPATPMTGPLAAYVDPRLARAAPSPSARSFAAGCDPDAAYDPAHPCHALEIAAAAPAPYAPPPAPIPEPVALPEAAPPPEAPPSEPPPPEAPAPAPDQGGWGIQVGAFASASLARSIALRARAEESDLLANAAISLPATTPFGGKILYRARLIDLPHTLAELACQRLNAAQLPCMLVRPA